MPNNKKILNLILALLIISSAYLIINNFNNKSTISYDNKFHIENISEITKIFLSDREGNSITLIKNKKDWTVNNKYIVKTNAIKTILSTFNKIRIKKPVSISSTDNVIKYIATSGINVEVYSKDKLIKSYLIGSSTPNHLGTYMILKGEKKPYVIHIPSFNGFLSPRYGIQNNILHENKWRSTNVFNISAQDISKIIYKDYIDTNNSYILFNKPIKLYANNDEIAHNSLNILNLLNSFKEINCESFKENSFKINNYKLIKELIVNSDTLKIFDISNKLTKDKNENYTVKRKLATLNNKNPMLIQDYVFNKILVPLNEIKK